MKLSYFSETDTSRTDLLSALTFAICSYFLVCQLACCMSDHTVEDEAVSCSVTWVVDAYNLSFPLCRRLEQYLENLFRFLLQDIFYIFFTLKSHTVCPKLSPKKPWDRVWACNDKLLLSLCQNFDKYHCALRRCQINFLDQLPPIVASLHHVHSVWMWGQWITPGPAHDILPNQPSWQSDKDRFLPSHTHCRI